MSEVSLNYVIGNSGDGSNFIEWVTDEKVIQHMQNLADDGDEAYASGDGLQLRTLIFANQEMLDWFVKRNLISFTTMKDFE